MPLKLLALVISMVFVAACGGTLDSQAGGPSNPTSAGVDAPASTEAAAEVRVVIETSMDLTTRSVRATYGAAADAARRFGGYVAEARIVDGKDATASLRVRVPSARHDDFLLALRELPEVKVTGEQTNAKEVTAEYTDLQSRLTNLQRSEAQYREILGRATTIPEIIQVSAKLDDVRGQVEQTQGRLNLLNDRTAFATVSLVLETPRPSARSGLPGPLDVLVRALDASLTVALAVVNVLIVALVAAVWLVPLALISLFGWRAFGARIRSAFAKIASW